jgi:hypothetical protein
VIRLNIGQRLQFGEHSDIAVEATGNKGVFERHVPIVVLIDDPEGTVRARSDWDHLKANRKGRARLIVSAMCNSEKMRVFGTAEILVR